MHTYIFSIFYNNHMLLVITTKLKLVELNHSGPTLYVILSQNDKITGFQVLADPNPVQT